MASIMTTQFTIDAEPGEYEAGKEEQKAFLSSILVGCLAGKQDDFVNLHRTAPSWQKLRGENWQAWKWQITCALDAQISYKRGSALIVGGIEASVAAYRRYFGVSGRPGEPPTLAPEIQAKAIREKENRSVGIFLQLTIDPTYIPKLVHIKEGQLASEMWPILKDASVADSFTEQQVITNKLQNFVVDLRTPFHMSIDRLRLLFAQYADATGGELNEASKVGYLLSAAGQCPSLIPQLSTVRTNIAGELQQVKFEKIARQLNVMEQDTRSRQHIENPNVTAGLHPLVSELDTHRRQEGWPAPVQAQIMPYVPPGPPVLYRPQVAANYQQPQQQYLAAYHHGSPSSSYGSLSPVGSDWSSAYSAGRQSPIQQVHYDPYQGGWASQAYANEARENVCYHCGGHGHRVPECHIRHNGLMAQAYASETQTNEIICFHCGGHGHRVPECQYRQRGLEARNDFKRKVTDTNNRANQDQRKYQAENNSNKVAWSQSNGAFSASLVPESNDAYSAAASRSWHFFKEFWPKKDGDGLPNGCRIANGTSIPVRGIGSIRFAVRLEDSTHEITINNILWVPEFSVNLISVAQLALKGFLTLFENDGAMILAPPHPKRPFEVVGFARFNGGSYVFAAQPIKPGHGEAVSHKGPYPGEKKVMADTGSFLSKEDYSMLWHQRLGHIPFSSVKKAMEQVKGIPSDLAEFDDCPICNLTKRARKPFHKNPERAQNLFDLVHIDFTGPHPDSMLGHRYALVCVDDYSRMVWVYFTRGRSAAETLEVLKTFKLEIEDSYDADGNRFRLRGLKSDNEFISKLIHAWTIENGISHQRTTPRSPQENGRAERMMRTLKEMARALIHGAHLPLPFWPWAMKHAAWIRNRLPHSLTGKTPRELWIRVPSRVEMAKVFGCLCYPMLQEDARIPGAFTPRSSPGIFLGFVDVRAKQVSVYLVHSGTIRVFRENEIRYDELSYWKWPEERRTLDDYQEFDRQFDLEDMTLPGGDVVNDGPGPAQRAAPEEYTPAPTPGTPRSYNRPPTDPGRELSIPPHWMAPEGSNRRGNTSPRGYAAHPDQVGTDDHVERRLEDMEPTVLAVNPTKQGLILKSEDARRIRTMREEMKALKSIPHDALDPNYEVYHSLATEDLIASMERHPPELGFTYPANTEHTRDQKVSLNGVTVSLKSMQAHDDWPKWEAAIREEVENHNASGTFRGVQQIPEGRQCVGSKWVFVHKYNTDGTIAKYKARLVGQGFTQRYGIDYEETFSPVVNFETLRALIATGIQMGHRLAMLDVKAAYLNAECQYEIYMRQPPSGSFANGAPYLRVHKSLYGLKASGREWYLTFVDYLKECHFVGSSYHHCVHLWTGGAVLFMYVDDIGLICKDKETEDEVIAMLQKKFTITRSAADATFLGMQFQPIENGLRLHQKPYVEAIIRKFLPDEATPIGTPFEPRQDVSPYRPKWPVDESTKTEYLSRIGALLWVANVSRPDISSAVGVLTRDSNSPGPHHFKAAERIFRYLKGTIDLGLHYTKSARGPGEDLLPLKLAVYSDADFAGDKETRKSTSGRATLLEGNLIAWMSKQQTTVAASTLDAEYIALSDASRHAIGLHGMINEVFAVLHTSPTVERPIPVFTDSAAAFANARGTPSSHSKVKHLDVRYHCIVHWDRARFVSIQQIKSQENIADALTKHLPGPGVRDFCSSVHLIAG
ncbi:unnamed protein product [Parajaminaea phylloscopi]